MELKKHKVVKEKCPVCGIETDMLITDDFDMLICECVATKGGWLFYRLRGHYELENQENEG